MSEKEYHMIATDNPYMAEIGLATFTSGTLYEWWNLKHNGSYVNRGYFNGFSSSDTGIFKLLEASSLGDTYGKYESCVWNSNSRKYENIDVKGIFSISRKNGGSLSYSLINATGYANTNIEASNPYTPHIYKSSAPTSGAPTGVVTSIIEHNNLVRLKSRDENFEPIANWVSGVSFSGPAQSLSAQSAKYKAAFVSAIKASISGCVNWKSDVEFNLNLNTLGECTYSQDIDFRLYLYDNKVDRDESRKISFVNTSAPVVGVPSNGVQKGFNDQGVIIPSRPVVGELMTQYDQRTGRFRSGTNQLIGIVTQSVEAGSSIDVQSVIDADPTGISTLIDKLPSGAAMPLFMQNGNPELWMPNLKSKRCDDSSEKELVNIYNFASKAFSVGTKVLLNEVSEGIWVPQDFGAEETSTPTSSIGDNWNFAYLMANRDNYFRSFDSNGEVGGVFGEFSKFTPETYESEFYKYYYRAMAVYYSTVNQEYYEDALLTSSGIPELYVSPIKFRHITSFDYMAENVGGTRGTKHGVGRTNFSKNLAAESLGGTDGKNLNGYETQFFGCVFPDGYSVDDIYRDGAQIIRSTNDLTDDDKKYFVADAASEYTTSAAPFAGGKNDNIWDSSSPAAVTDGMFTQACVDAGYIHLPADIAVHGINSPIIKYPNLHENHTLGVSSFSDIKDYGNDRWTILEIKNGSTYEDFSYEISVNNQTVLQFRPLSLENYAAYEAYTSPSIQRYTILDPNPKTVPSFGYYNYSDKLGSTKTTTSTYSRNVYKRSDYVENPDADTPLENIVRYGAFDQSFGPPAGQSLDGISLGCLYYTDERAGNYNAPSCWDTEFANEPSFAVGIITAKCDGYTTKSTIDISITSFIGINYNSYTLLGQQHYELHWGGNSSISEFDTTELYMKAYCFWPNDLTVFDPRFFSVHHYNYGFNAVLDSYTECDGAWYIDGSPATISDLTSAVQNPPAGINHNNGQIYGGYKDAGVPYWVYSSGTQADYRIPTLAEDNTGSYFGGYPAPIGTLALSDEDLYRSPEDWVVEPKARGKLLPFNYKHNTIGISGINGLLNSINVDSLSTETPLNYAVVIQSFGSNYSIGDTFKVEGGNGSGVILDINGINSDSYEFRVLSAGEGYLPSDFMRSTDILLDSNPTDLRLVQLLSDGEGLEGYVTRGKVVSNTKTVQAPTKVISSRRISPDTSNAGVIDRVEEKSIPISTDSGYTNPYTNRYSFFFHFHNGCSYTLYDNNYNLTGSHGSQQPRQQHITIDIS